MTDAAPAAPAPAGQAPGQGTPPAAPAASPPAAPAAGDKPWYDGHITVPEDIGYIQNKAWKTPGDMLGAYKNLEKFHGVPPEQLLKLPKDMADEKAMGEVYTRLGRPETPEEYQFKAPDSLKDIKIDEGRMKFANGISHKLGLNKAQHNALVAATLEYENGIMSEAQKDVGRIQTEQMESLKKEWGDAYPERESLGRRAVRTFLPGTPEQKETLADAIEGALGTAITMKLFANIGAKLGEDKIHEGDSGGRPFGYTPEQAKADMATLMIELKDPTNKERLTSYNQGKGKDYDTMQRLQRIAHGVKAA